MYPRPTRYNTKFVFRQLREDRQFLYKVKTFANRDLRSLLILAENLHNDFSWKRPGSESEDAASRSSKALCIHICMRRMLITMLHRTIFTLMFHEIYQRVPELFLVQLFFNAPSKLPHRKLPTVWKVRRRIVTNHSLLRPL